MKETKYYCDVCKTEMAKPMATITIKVLDGIKFPFVQSSFQHYGPHLNNTYELCTDCLYEILDCLGKG